VVEDPSSSPPAPQFEFHSHFWNNLHHFLYQEARPPSPGARRASTRSRLAEEEFKVWSEAVGYYRQELARRDLVFDAGMREMEDRLVRIAADQEPPEGVVAGPHRQTLLRVAPLYEKHFWPEHDRKNQEWIERAKRLSAEYGEEMGSLLSGAFQVDWPREPVRVDALCYANWAGGYTSPFPPHIRICAQPVRVNTDVEHLELLFHESCHLLINPMQGPIVDRLQKYAQQASGKVPRDLWHALIFEAAASAVHQVLQPEEFTPYAHRNGLYGRGEWRHFEDSLVDPWNDYFDGITGLEELIPQLLEAVWESQEH
jgi:hypothetical protein